MQTFIICLSFLVRCMLKQCFILSYTIIKVLCTQKNFFPSSFQKQGRPYAADQPEAAWELTKQPIELCTSLRSEITGVNHHTHLLLRVLFSFFFFFFLNRVLFAQFWLVFLELTKIHLPLPCKYQKFEYVPKHGAYTEIINNNWIPLSMKHQLYSKTQSR